MNLLSWFAVLLIPAPAAAAQVEAPACELHVWPTANLNAFFHGATARSIITGNIAGEVTARPDAQTMLAQTADGAFQREAIEELQLGATGRFAGYRVIIHSISSDPRFARLAERNVGAGAREAPSTALCYAELHVVMITLMGTALTKQLQSGVILREFGASGPATGWAFDALDTGAPAFPARVAEQDAETRRELKAAFQRNLGRFLNGRAIQRLRRPR